jgi:hypothetical protein
LALDKKTVVFPRPQLTEPSLAANMLSLEPDFYTSRGHPQNASSSSGLHSMIVAGRRAEGNHTACKMTTAVRSAIRSLSPLPTSSSPVPTLERFGSLCCLVGVGEGDHPMVLKTVLRTGGRQLEEGFTNRKEELSTP